MKVITTTIEGLLVLDPRVYEDDRGYFLETWQGQRYEELGIPPFVQDNLSYSNHGVLRGLHFQHPGAQGKLVQVLNGEVFDVAVDIRYGSPTFGRWFGVTLSSSNHRQFWIPGGFAHGFVVTSESALFLYKCSQPYQPQTEHCIRWDDPTLQIDWPIGEPTISAKDEAGLPWTMVNDILTD